MRPGNTYRVARRNRAKKLANAMGVRLAAIWPQFKMNSHRKGYSTNKTYYPKMESA